MCNYSSKPSSLTARILDSEHLPTPAVNRTHVSTGMGDQDKSDSNSFFGQSSTIPSGSLNKQGGNLNTSGANIDSTKRRVSQEERNTKRELTLPQYVTTQEPSDEANENAEAMRILRLTAQALGLKNGELHAVLPTVQKLVRVITQHVPRLEEFVEEVCDVVLLAEDQSEQEKDRDYKTPQRKVKRRRNRNMEARKERMDTAVRVLKDTRETGKSNSDEVLKEINANTASNAAVSKCNHQYSQSSEASFTTVVKEKLARRQDACSSHVMTPISSNIHDRTTKGLLTDGEAIQEVNRLIEFEEKYATKLNGLVTAEEDSANRSPSVDSPPHSDTVLQDLLSADTTTLRRFVLHFAYLFSVRQDNVLNKMNDLYVFSHEATNLINDVKKAMDLPSSCPIHSVARKVVAAVESKQRTKS